MSPEVAVASPKTARADVLSPSASTANVLPDTLRFRAVTVNISALSMRRLMFGVLDTPIPTLPDW